jgi:hypothetical protein
LAQLFYRTGHVLSVTGPSGTQEFTMAELKALQSTGGYGGWKNKVGTIVAPILYKGVSVRALMDLVGGGTTITVVASDGYEMKYTAAAVSGDVPMYDPATGAEMTPVSGKLTVIVAYAAGGGVLTSDEGAVRIAFVSALNDQVTDSKNWAKQVVAIKVE